MSRKRNDNKTENDSDIDVKWSHPPLCCVVLTLCCRDSYSERDTTTTVGVITGSYHCSLTLLFEVTQTDRIFSFTAVSHPAEQANHIPLKWSISERDAPFNFFFWISSSGAILVTHFQQLYGRIQCRKTGLFNLLLTYKGGPWVADLPGRGSLGKKRFKTPAVKRSVVMAVQWGVIIGHHNKSAPPQLPQGPVWLTHGTSHQEK